MVGKGLPAVMTVPVSIVRRKRFDDKGDRKGSFRSKGDRPAKMRYRDDDEFPKDRFKRDSKRDFKRDGKSSSGKKPFNRKRGDRYDD